MLRYLLAVPVSTEVTRAVRQQCADSTRAARADGKVVTTCSTSYRASGELREDPNAEDKKEKQMLLSLKEVRKSRYHKLDVVREQFHSLFEDPIGSFFFI